MKRGFVSKFLPYLLISIGAIYGFWPIDAIPDIPIVGWIDDIGVIGTTILIALMLLFKKEKKVSEENI